ncbi:MAG: HIT domain-containing protein [Deltaproteobacteria bacterium]|nr:HIT domain-containing protein [Deltaproteobacteria bacterium]
MDRMYAPWRLAFVEGKKAEALPCPSGCIFCDYPVHPDADVPDAQKDSPPSPASPKSTHNPKLEKETRARWDAKRLVVTAREHAFVILNKYPYTNGHVMVVPYAHTDQLESLDEDAFLSVHQLLRETIAAVRKAYAPHGINVGMNMGQAAGAGIAEHVHYHVLPRWNGDTNFMPVFSDTRVISEGISDTYKRLVGLLRKPSEGFFPTEKNEEK